MTIRRLATADIITGTSGELLIMYTVIDPMGNVQGMTVTPDVAHELRRVLFPVLVDPRISTS